MGDPTHGARPRHGGASSVVDSARRSAYGRERHVATEEAVMADDTRIYEVVINHEEQYSPWPADRENPSGWQDAGKRGTRGELEAYIRSVWTDMRPLSLRRDLDVG